MENDVIGNRIRHMDRLMRIQLDHSLGGQPDKTTLLQNWIIKFLMNRERENLDTFQKDIESRFDISRSTTSEIMTLLCDKEMIKREPVKHDKRLKLIVLTQKGYDYIHSIEHYISQMHSQMMAGLSEEEIDAFCRVSDKIIENLKNAE